MKRIQLKLMFILAVCILLTGCDFLEGKKCFQYDAIKFKRLGQRDWEVPAGVWTIQMVDCSNITIEPEEDIIEGDITEEGEE